ncbi:tRNA dimethylallyltransferase, mitochondrial [Coemansia sp. RSA 2049]|nr:tRNA dimethylallyltransferase, mitochondrial [Coemansia sp. RSA 2049]
MDMNHVRKGLIAITGTTGVGKSQLAIELARAVNGEVINADALQVYRGYNVITNKVTKEEAATVHHHLLGFVDPTQEYSVQRFEHDALQKIDEIHRRNRVPILVGGTNYYIQSVLFRKSLISSSSRHRILTENGLDVDDLASEDDDRGSKETAVERAFEASKKNISNQKLWEELKRVDPLMAEKWHPNNRRKVLRSLEVSQTTGRRHSEWVQESEAARSKEETLRFPTLLFWLYAEKDVLNKRLDERVDKMVERGLFDEVSQLAKDLNDASGAVSGGPKDDFSIGLKQAIGFREFQHYLRTIEAIAADVQDADGGSDGRTAAEEEAESLKDEGLVDMKTSTRRYAKRQISWIRNKLIPECRETANKSTNAHAYILDATDLDNWDSCVREKGTDIAERFINNRALPDAASVSPVAQALFADIKDKPETLVSWKRYHCSVCSKTVLEAKDGVAHGVWLNGEDEYHQHLRSRQHKKNLRYRKRFLTNVGDPPSQDDDASVPAKRANIGSSKDDDTQQ